MTSYLSTALSKILPHLKTVKNAKKLSVFGENDSHCLSCFLQAHIFWKLDHISRTYNQINGRDIWFAKVTIIDIMLAQVLFFNIFFEKDPHLNAVWFSFSNVVWNDNLLKDRRVIHRVWTSGTLSDNKWQWVVQQITTNDIEWYNEWQRMILLVELNAEVQCVPAKFKIFFANFTL